MSRTIHFAIQKSAYPETYYVRRAIIQRKYPRLIERDSEPVITWCGRLETAARHVEWSIDPEQVTCGSCRRALLGRWER